VTLLLPRPKRGRMGRIWRGTACNGQGHVLGVRRGPSAWVCMHSLRAAGAILVVADGASSAGHGHVYL
jgi:hypothetical protein